MKPQKLALVLSFLLSSQAAVAAYYTVLQESYTPSNFFSKFNFYTGSDPTNGFVQYIDQATAAAKGMISTSSSSVYIGVDNSTVNPTSGRASVRLESIARFQRGLIILDLSHMPGSICGSWPAFWTLGDNWPNNGEIDIIEGVNDNTINHMALHTSTGCTITGSGSTGTLLTPNCDVNAAGQASNAGCSFADTRSSSYGSGFNAIGGGVYATEWNGEFIKVWFFPRSGGGATIPADVLGANPAPENWGTPVATFQGDCDIDEKFTSHRIIFNITFCGDWAGNVWTGYPACVAKATTCTEFVKNNPSAFGEAYWRINSLKVFSS